MPVHKVALFGMGRAGTIHFRNVICNRQLALIYVVEEDAGRAVALLADYQLTGSVAILSPNEVDVIYNDAAIEAVIVATPTFTHSAIVMTALQHGKAVFCEKPIGENLATTKACYEEAEKSKRPLFCSFNRRFDPSLRIARERVLNKEVGTIHMIKATSRDSPAPSLEYLKTSGGLFNDCSVHDVDLVCWVAGEYPTKVYAQATAHSEAIRRLGDVDSAAVVMTFASGVIAVIDLDRDAQYGADQRLEVFGDRGMVISENQTQSGVVALNAQGTHRDMLHYSFPQRYAQSYINSLQHFIDIIEGKAVCDVTKENILLVSHIAEACLKSHKTGLPVKIDHSVSGISCVKKQPLASCIQRN